MRRLLCGCEREKILLKSQISNLTKEMRVLRESNTSLDKCYQEHKEREAMLKKTINTLTKQIHEQKAVIDYTLLEKEKLEKQVDPENAS